MDNLLNDLRTGTLTNILEEDFTFRYANQPITIPAGKTTKELPLWLVEHGAERLIDRIILTQHKYKKRTPIGGEVEASGGVMLNNVPLREEIKAKVLTVTDDAIVSKGSKKSKEELVQEKIAALVNEPDEVKLDDGEETEKPGTKKK